MDERQMEDKRTARKRRWAERQERSRLNRSEGEALRKQRQELRAALDAVDEGKQELAEQISYTRFDQLPLSQRTQLGLERGGYKLLTPIQSDALHLALAGYDVLGAARTGSGKTLCFIVPLLELLYVEQWEAEMGIGALVLSPTRELALQIFKVLQLVGYKHVMSAALLTGGRDVNEERKRVSAISIIVGTPGRVLHHLEDDDSLVTDNLQMLVMDEADRLLDMGFREVLSGILKQLPTQRQTLMFSATQTTDVQMLGQMSLRNQRYVSAHAECAAPTPSTLCQNFVVVELHRKLDVLLLFLKRHPNDKFVVFVSTCNQVRYMYLAFAKILKKMHLPCMCLTSKMKQFRREEVFLTFCRCKNAVLFCTDVAARGLDFPLIHWSVQFDCPDSAQTYIHRAGRTARAGARGVSLLFLTPREVPMLSFLAHKHIPLREIAVRPQMLRESKEIFVALVVQGLKYEAQKAFIAYLRSVYFAANKLVFDVKSIDVAPFAHSLGLMKVPDMSELGNLQRGAKNLPWDVVNFMAKRDAKEVADAKSRRERHLTASDMFRTLQQKQRYATTDSTDVDLAADANINGEDEEKNDPFLVKKPHEKGNEDHLDEGMQLTFTERMAGLSKRKVRKYIESADLRVRDLGLSKRVVYDEDDDAEEDEINMRVANEGQDISINVEGGSGSDNDLGDVPEKFAERLRQRVTQDSAADNERAKKLRRLRRLQRSGKISRKTALEDISAPKGTTDAVDSDDHTDDNSPQQSSNDYDDGDISVHSSDSFTRLIKAAKGELFSDNEDEDISSSDNGNFETEKKKKKKIKKKKEEKRLKKIKNNPTPQKSK
ncbi:ATP-dependent DEAD/H RNA helicase, putative [Trypanosoma brucei brucei TREU927]|uniref:ATP-dependent RNA helicase n=1 Tax=Trypanosoma brucei brucei (strain 927/4 GUTat10.1) TaxID=185431 RepID=Q57Z22_TRYB2|nr:ATP-dependent DEAD/H RNA helicase, putative [Trypanosoma brucei brucei TREU927]AAX80577.1 ATP-dependent DEAD/H RNA helicase, putative [Trypanosoma brucei]AAZ11538.1 ATP-dependent DEAD/H RNA helicase, putative [Trypanosoma brucei brucei TREU927]